MMRRALATLSLVLTAALVGPPPPAVAESTSHIAGITRNDAGIPVAVEVELFEPGANTRSTPYDDTYSDSDGRYAMEVPAGTYTLCAGSDSSGPVDRRCLTDVVVPESGLTAHDVSLPRNTVMTGRVTVAGDPFVDLSSLAIEAYPEDRNSQAHNGSVAADGTYAIALPPGSYLFRFRGYRLSSLAVEELFWPADGSYFTVGAGEVAGPNPVLTQETGLMGSLTVPLNVPDSGPREPWESIETYEIRAYGESATSVEDYRNSRHRDFRGADGGVATARWHVSVEPGKYRIGFRRESDGAYLWYGGGTSLATAPLVEVTAGKATQGLHARWGTTLAPYAFGRPTISGSAKTGQTLTVNPNPATWPAGTTFTYQWPDGSTERTYLVRSRDNQAFAPMINVEVTGHTPGYVPVTLTTPYASTAVATPPPPPPLAFPSTLAVTGKARVGATISVVSYHAGPGAVHSFKWYAGNKVLPKVKSSKYRIARTVRRQVLSVVVTASRNGKTITRRLTIGRVK